MEPIRFAVLWKERQHILIMANTSQINARIFFFKYTPKGGFLQMLKNKYKLYPET